LGRSAIVADEREGERSVFGIENSVPNRHLINNKLLFMWAFPYLTK
jgi:hypothetical protein